MSPFQFDGLLFRRAQPMLNGLLMGMTKRQKNPAALYLSGANQSDKAPLEQFENYCTEHKSSKINILLSGELTSQFIEPIEYLNEPANRSHKTILKVAMEKFLSYENEVNSSHSYTAWANNRNYGGCCLHGIKLTEVNSIARKNLVTISTIEPWWAWMLRWLSKKVPTWNHNAAATLVLVEGKFFTWLHCENGYLKNIQQRRLAEPRWPDLRNRIDELNIDINSATVVWVAGYGLIADVPPEGTSWQILTPLTSKTMPEGYLAI